ncbi:spherulin-1B [Elysia marginata]|uniref:Spherulin-1B n=1 Tax=Elysia marginata TaxID=1093978 RepID=A0AAV4ITY1_9GAST|nr:spherulin-1B [Elysia marginata]
MASRRSGRRTVVSAAEALKQIIDDATSESNYEDSEDEFIPSKSMLACSDSDTSSASDDETSSATKESCRIMQTSPANCVASSSSINPPAVPISLVNPPATSTCSPECLPQPACSPKHSSSPVNPAAAPSASLNPPATPSSPVILAAAPCFDIIKSRKRKRQEKDWVVNKRKKAVDSGQAHVNSMGKAIPPKAIKTTKDCVSGCKFKCSVKINGEEREQIFSEFYGLDHSEKQMFLVANKKEESPKRLTKGTQSGRKKSFSYFFHLKGEAIRVSKAFL